MMTRKITLGVAAAVSVVTLTVAGCSSAPTAQDKENAEQQAASEGLVSGQPVPHPPYSLMRQNLSEIRVAEATGSVATTSFEFMQGITHPIKSCASVGLPIPANASISNPHQVVPAHTNGVWSNEVVDQMEPNGIYPSGSTSGTYVMCLQPNGKARTVYWEGTVHSETGAAHWDNTTQQIVSDGDTSYHFSTKCVLNGNVPVCN